MIYRPINAKTLAKKRIYAKNLAKKRKVERRADAEAHLLQHGRTGILSTPDRRAIAEVTATDRSLVDAHPDERLRGKSLDDLFADESFCGYIGETMRTLEIEALRWLSKRGSMFHASGRNRPVLAWAPEDEDGQPVVIKESEAKAQLGFRSVYTCTRTRRSPTPPSSRTSAAGALQRPRSPAPPPPPRRHGRQWLAGRGGRNR